MRTRPLLTVLSAAALASCGLFQTLDYREVQSRFNEAVALDNGATVSGNPFAEADYEGVLQDLTSEDIDLLEPRLRANAWLLRSFAEWRTDRLGSEGAAHSAANGLAQKPATGSRDEVLLRLMTALVIDRELELAWGAAGQQLSLAAYNPGEHAVAAPTQTRDYESDFATALDAWNRAKRAAGAATPPTTLYYLEYQRWRILQNWQAVIFSIQAGDDTDAVRGKELRDAGGIAGQQLKDLERESLQAIPENHALRALIRAVSGAGGS